MHASVFQQSQALSLAAVLHVAEVEAGYKDPKANVGHLAEELGQSEGAVGTGRPGAEPGDGVTESLSSISIPPHTRAQGSQITQEQQL